MYWKENLLIGGGAVVIFSMLVYLMWVVTQK